MADSENVAYLKSEMRLRARAARRAVMPEQREAASHAVTEALLALPEMVAARAVLVYGSMPEEVDTAELIESLWSRGVRVALPRVRGRRDLQLHWHERDRELCIGAYGLKEPCPKAPEALPSEIDLVVVPGVAYDLECRRLGLGAGYYDTLLAEMRGTAVTVGVAFDEQLAREVPCGAHDERVDVLVTPTRVVRR
ncbi:MAG: 5-formyltetrahydrofolate cyclo-ligase [Actinobacteria bacterium HGW-Actinobacteria-1]|jgi:5-formyltetrahydrofolate cyclo-ligase|nr:MAG: 5-formyltetrahydrofolate cyclo-ligase [Actinobacteria bacterium HGW-Actinobacteria-1]